MAQQLIEENDIKIEIAEIKVEECYNWANDLVLLDNKNWYEEFQPNWWIEAKVNLKPVENVCKCKKMCLSLVGWPQNIRNIVICFIIKY